MTEFKNGDKVTVREGATSIGGQARDPKEVRTVRTVWDDGRVGLYPVQPAGPGNVFESEDLVPYVEGPAPSEFDLGYEAGRKAGLAAAAVEAKGLTVDELRALPKGAVVLDSVGDAWESEGSDRWVWINPYDPTTAATLNSGALHRDWAPLHQPAPENSNEE
jgi:hypothetical protein